MWAQPNSAVLPIITTKVLIISLLFYIFFSLFDSLRESLLLFLFYLLPYPLGVDRCLQRVPLYFHPLRFVLEVDRQYTKDRE